MHKVPNLYRNRLGTYYLRVIVAGKEHKRSLGTKDRPKAVKAALLFALARDESVQFDTTASCEGVAHRGFRGAETLALNRAVHGQQPMLQGEPMKNIPSVLRQGRGASDIDRPKAEAGADSSTHGVPDIGLPEAATKLDVLRGADGSIHITNVHSDEDEARALRMVQALRAGDMHAAIALAAPSTGVPAAHLQPIAAMADISAASRAAHTSEQFTKVQRLYLDEMEHHNSSKTRDDKAATYADFVSVVGELRIDDVSAEQAQKYKQTLLKRLGPDGKPISAIRTNTKISHLSELFEWAINNHYMHVANPFKTMRVSKKSEIKKKQENYESFSESDLKAIFHSPEYVPYLNESDYYWLPWMGLHTGARLEELASLDLANIKEEDGIHYFDIRKGKTANSIRRIPVHDNLIKAGFLDFVKKQRARGETLLFSHLVKGKNGYSKNMSRRFGQYLDKLGIKDPLKVFHSFRSTFIAKMSEKNVHPAMLMALVGHYDQAKVDLSSPHFQNYKGGQKLISVLKETMGVFDPGPITMQPPPAAFRSELKPRKTVSKKADIKKPKA